MKVFKWALLLFTLTLVGCAKPVPAEKASYVGEWQEKTMYLLITQDGSVRYKRLKEKGVTTSIEGPLKGFEGDNFTVGVGPMSTVFIVSRPPYQEGDLWKMVVDGVELVRTAQ
ncbi:MAG TPA: hypothetical protein VGE50_13025 [Gammaproteobacteria bacterium]